MARRSCSTLFCRQTTLRTAAFTQNSFYPHMILHREVCAQRIFYTQTPLRRGFFAKRLLHTEARTSTVAVWTPVLFLLPLPDHLPFVLPFPSCYWCSNGGSGGCWGSYHTSRVMCQLPLSLHARVRILHCREDACEAVGRVCTADICEFLPVVPHTRRGSFKDRTL